MSSASSASSSSSFSYVSVNPNDGTRLRNPGGITGQPLSKPPEPISSERIDVPSSDIANGSSVHSKARDVSERSPPPSGLLPIFRSLLLRYLPGSSHRIARLQSSLRTPWFDWWFLLTSFLGATTFFMIFLPIFFFFGYPAMGRELVLVLAAGIYFSSLIKDLVQVPRPSCPPATRLSFEYHALEYGFPSSHCTSTTSLAIYYFMFLSRFQVESLWMWFGGGSVVVFLWSNVCFGRLYCGMHSAIDCLFGIILGLVLAYLTELSHPFLEVYLAQTTALVPFTLILGTTVLAGIRPEPELPCPCFGDAIAFFSVAMGTSMARWLETRFSGDQWDTLGTVNRWSEVERGDGSGRLSGWEGWLVWVLLIGGKYLFGIAVIVLYRLVAKLSLPLIYRALLGPSSNSSPSGHESRPTPSANGSSSSSLSPNTALTRPPLPSPARTLSTESNSSRTDIDLVPSVVDLGALNEPVVKSEPKDHTQGATDGREPGSNGGVGIVVEGEDGEEVRWKGSRSTGSQGEGEVLKSTREVVTKVIVYSGIGLFAGFFIPLIFVTSGVGLRST